MLFVGVVVYTRDRHSLMQGCQTKSVHFNYLSGNVLGRSARSDCCTRTGLSIIVPTGGAGTLAHDLKFERQRLLCFLEANFGKA